MLHYMIHHCINKDLDFTPKKKIPIKLRIVLLLKNDPLKQ